MPDQADLRPDPSPGTLGDVLYAGKKALVPEREWAGLLKSVAARDPLALHALYERSHALVFTLALRITGNAETAGEVTLDVFHDVWRRAWGYDPVYGTVLGWIMNQARSRALDRLRFTNRNKRSGPNTTEPLERRDVNALRPAPSLPDRLARRIVRDRRHEAGAPAAPRWAEPEWEEVAAGISCKLLATDTDRHRVSMLVRLLPNGEYPPHTHAGLEELHLLEGELWIDDRQLFPGDYNRAEPSTSDKRVWSETGCTCVLVTSTRDVLH